MSKTTSLSQNFSRWANYLKFTVKNNILVGNTQPYGTQTIEQTRLGVNYPNVQSAIDDIVSMYTLPIDAVLTNTSGDSPSGVSQVDEYVFSGTVAVEGKNVGETVKFDCFGFYTDVLVGDTGEEVASKVKFTLDLAASNGNVINSVNTGATLNILQVKYNDVQSHDLGEITNAGVTIKVNKLSPARYGYGVWDRIGTQTITLDGSTAPTTLYYFKRVD